MSADSQGTKCRRRIAENYNRLSRVHERYRRQTTDRQTTDGRGTAYSERIREFAFANNAPLSHGSLFEIFLGCVTPAWVRKLQLQCNRIVQHERIL